MTAFWAQIKMIAEMIAENKFYKIGIFLCRRQTRQAAAMLRNQLAHRETICLSRTVRKTQKDAQ